MKKRWIINLLLLLVVVGLATFLHFRPNTGAVTETKYEVSQLKLADINAVKVEFPAQAPVEFEKTDGYWHMKAPYQARADQLSVQRILAIVAATSKDKFPKSDAAKYGIDQPQIKVRLIGKNLDEAFIFGTHNPITEEQYVAYRDSVYLLPVSYGEAAGTQPIEMVDKNLLAPSEAKQIVAFDFSRLEQWQDTQLKVQLTDGKWTTNLDKAKPKQNEMNEWLEYVWKQNPAKAVEFYRPDRKMTYPSLEIKLQDGKKIHLDKIAESPELLLGRPDIGQMYHYSNDIGFNMLNPPINLK